MLIVTFYGKYVSYPKYSIPSIDYANNLLFAIYDDKYMKFVLTNKKGEFIQAKYIEKKINMNNIDLIKELYENSNNIIEKNKYNVKDIEYYDNFIPEKCLEDNIIFTIWYGKSFTSNRNLQYLTLKKVSKCRIININENNINLLKYPIHKGFQYLSSIHKSDYLRCYLMYYYGGGYSDLKKTSSSWIPAFNKLKNNDKLWAVGYNCDGVALPGNLQKEKYDYNETTQKYVEILNKNKNNFIGVGFFIFKKNSEIVIKWFNELNKRLDNFYQELKKYPAKFDRESKNGTPKPSWEGGNFNTKYPICWNRILGQILYPLQLYYLDKITKGIPERSDNGKYK